MAGGRKGKRNRSPNDNSDKKKRGRKSRNGVPDNERKQRTRSRSSADRRLEEENNMSENETLTDVEAGTSSEREGANITAASIDDDGLNISMEVTENEFPDDDATEIETEDSEEGEIIEDAMESVTDVPREDAEITFRGQNNNATGAAMARNLDDSYFENFLQNKASATSTSAVAGEDFMHQFATFMEKKGFIEKKKENKEKKAAQHSSGNHGNQATKKQGHGQGPHRSRKEDFVNRSRGNNEQRTNRTRDNSAPTTTQRPGLINMQSPSEVTIYKRAVAMSLNGEEGNEVEMNHVGEDEEEEEKEKRCSTSSEELNNTSGESLIEIINLGNAISERRRTDTRPVRYVDDGAIPHTSRRELPPPPQRLDMTPAEKAEKLIRQAEMAKARIYEVPGMENVSCNQNEFNDMIHSVIVDEAYSSIEAHVEESVKRRVMADEFIDFAQLLPRNRTVIMDEEEQGLQQMFIKGGVMYCRPAHERGNESNGISSIHAWDQAFRIFAHLYTKAFPRKAAELMQYNHVIHSAAQSYAWENVYATTRILGIT